jgi:hypothetical protein
MAISRHDPEWQRVIAMAALGGVVFYESIEGPTGRMAGPKYTYWYAELPTGARYRGNSKFEVAKCALAYLGAKVFLPDAATPRSAPAASPATRTEEFTC